MRKSIAGLMMFLFAGASRATLPGNIVSWGRDDYGQVSDTPTRTYFTAIDGGTYRGVALASDGSIVSWGDDSYGQVSNTPTGTGFTAVAGGGFHSLALQSDGSIVSWGWNYYGQVGLTPTRTGFTAVAAGWNHSLALESDGSIISWGDDSYGQVGNTPTGTGFTAVAGGGHHSLALRVPPVPEFINYQGRLNDSAGNPLHGVSVDLTFRFYDQATTDSLSLTVKQEGVQVADGIFNVLIGSGIVKPGTEDGLADLFQNNRAVWMSTEVGNDGEMSPRVPIGSVGYSMTSGNARNLSHIEPRDTAPADPVMGDIYVDSADGKLYIYDGTTWQACW